MSLFRYQQLAEGQQAHIWTLRFVIAALLAVNTALWYGWHTAPRHLTVHIPPDLRSGSTQHIDAVPDYTVYVFASHVFQQLNRWQNDGATDFGQRIYALSPYLTPRYRQRLLDTYASRGREGLLTDRIRAVAPVPGQAFDADRVTLIGQDTWVVSIDMQLLEAAYGMTIKRPVIRYPIRVVRFDIDRERNPWGLALDGYQQQPERLPLQEAGNV